MTEEKSCVIIITRKQNSPWQQQTHQFSINSNIEDNTNTNGSSNSRKKCAWALYYYYYYYYYYYNNYYHYYHYYYYWYYYYYYYYYKLILQNFSKKSHVVNWYKLLSPRYTYDKIQNIMITFSTHYLWVWERERHIVAWFPMKHLRVHTHTVHDLFWPAVVTLLGVQLTGIWGDLGSRLACLGDWNNKWNKGQSCEIWIWKIKSAIANLFSTQ